MWGKRQPLHGKPRRSVSRIGVGSLEQHTDCVRPRIRMISTAFHAWRKRSEKKSPMQSWGELTLSPEQLAAGGDGEQQSGYVDTCAHLIGILKRIVDEKTEESWHAPWIHTQPLSLSLPPSLSLSLSQSTDTPFSTSVLRIRTVAHMRKRANRDRGQCRGGGDKSRYFVFSVHAGSANIKHWRV